MEEIKEAIKYLEEKIKECGKQIKELKELKNFCWLCGKKQVTKHSIRGNHIKPFIPLCRECHDFIENIKNSIEAVKGSPNSKLSVTQFRKMINTFDKIEL